jgi:hypothetical protein
MSNYDAFILTKQASGEDPKPRLLDKQLTKNATALVNDTESIFEIKVDSTHWVDFSALTTALSFPIVTRVERAAGTGTLHRYNTLVGPKPAGFLSYIQRIQINVNNSIVAGSSDYLGIMAYLRYIRSTSRDFNAVVGPLLGMSGLDCSADLSSWFVNTSVTPAIISNNQVRGGRCDVPSIVTTANAGFAGLNSRSTYQNLGLFRRAMLYSFQNHGSTGHKQSTQTVEGDAVVIRTQGFIPLKFLHPFFDAAGMLSGVNVRITLAFNNVEGYRAVITAAAGADSTAYPGGQITVVGSVSPKVLPFQQCETAIVHRDGDAGIAAISGSIGASVVVDAPEGVVDSGLGVAFTVGANTVVGANALCAPVTISSLAGRDVAPNIYLTTIKLFPEDDAAFRAKSRVIKFMDHTVAQTFNVPANQAFNFQFTNNSKGVTAVTLLGYATSASRVERTSGYQACTSEPFHSTPLFSLRNANLTINGQPTQLMPSDEVNRDFVENLLSNALNAGETKELCSGLYSKQDFDRSKIYYWDVSHVSSTAEGVSLHLDAYNSSPFAVDLIAFIEGMKEVSIKYNHGANATVGTTAISL